MDEENKLLQNIDKVSYGAAALLAVVILALPAFSGGGSENEARQVSELYARLEEKIRTQPEQQVDRPDWAQAIARLWETPGDDRRTPAWVPERAPILVCAYVKRPPEKAVHQPGYIASIECMRDPEKLKPFVRVSGRMSQANKLIEITGVTLLRKVDDGDFEEVRGFVARGDFDYDDYDVEPGRRYAYKFISRAQPARDAENVDFSDLVREQESPPLGPTEPLPYDFSFHVSLWGSDPTSPTVSAAVDYWDYEKGEKASIRRRTFKEGESFGPERGGKKRYQIRYIFVDKKEIRIRDLFTREQYVLKAKDAVRRNVECWTALTGEAPGAAPPPANGPTASSSVAESAPPAAEPEVEGPPASTAQGTEAEPEAEPSPPRRGRRRGFR